MGPRARAARLSELSLSGRCQVCCRWHLVANSLELLKCCNKRSLGCMLELIDVQKFENRVRHNITVLPRLEEFYDVSSPAVLIEFGINLYVSCY
ncbi:hypothetical protein Y032_0409g930 [Ancylostoma ceylanicum]|uniref:Uncharacterized protein n=1 Tax=Ancylostoma ceylanicum TaxID=53326 RepID=A0A016X4B7_9BILA|nr:hypothetical protein Y032_0409g930 [Ancylostoma ceylanicum]